MIGEKNKVYRESLACGKCGSFNTYSLKDKTLICRKCGHKDEKNKEDNTQNDRA